MYVTCTVPDLGNGTGNIAFSGCYAILTSPKEGETAVYGYNPALFWVLLVSCWCLAELIFTQYDQYCSILLAELICLQGTQPRLFFYQKAHKADRPDNQNFWIRVPPTSSRSRSSRTTDYSSSTIYYSLQVLKWDLCNAWSSRNQCITVSNK